jgi:hypothetical protein
VCGSRLNRDPEPVDTYLVRAMLGRLKNLRQVWSPEDQRQFWALGGLSLEQNRQTAIRDDGNVSVAHWDGLKQRFGHIVGEQSGLCGASTDGKSWTNLHVTPSAAILDPGVCDECVRQLQAVLEEAGNTVDACWRDAVRGRAFILSLRRAV